MITIAAVTLHGARGLHEAHGTRGACRGGEGGCERWRAAGGGGCGRGGVHVLLHRDDGAAHRRRGRRGDRGPAAGRGAAGRDRRPGARRRVPRDARQRPVRQRTAARGRGPAGPLGRPGRGRVRRAAVPGQGTGRAAHVRGARRHRADDPQADPRLPGRGRGGLLGAHTRRDRGPWSRVPPHHRGPGEPGGPAPPAWTFGGRKEGFVQGGVHASYLHLHWAGYPGLARRLVAAAA